MKEYECINTFTSKKGEFYAKGVSIYEDEYYGLTSVDKVNFKEKKSHFEEFDLPLSKNRRYEDDTQEWTRSVRMGEGEQEYREATRDNDIPDSRDDSFDFGGGDSGGAGASDDY